MIHTQQRNTWLVSIISTHTFAICNKTPFTSCLVNQLTMQAITQLCRLASLLSPTNLTQISSQYHYRRKHLLILIWTLWSYCFMKSLPRMFILGVAVSTPGSYWFILQTTRQLWFNTGRLASWHGCGLSTIHDWEGWWFMAKSKRVIHVGLG